MASLQPHLTSFLEALPPRPVDKETLNEHVKRVLSDTSGISSAENRKSRWEYLLKDDVFKLAAQEGAALKKDEKNYYSELCFKLDIVLTFAEHDACDQTIPLTVLQDLLETQTIKSCSQIFSWIELRADRLTVGMVPQKGKALILLRTLNDLLRRLSKMGNTTMFCGRILTFLSGVFPLGERSGVNLRGEYGPTWEGVQHPDRIKVDADESKVRDVSDANKMDVDSLRPTLNEGKEDFYDVFWSLQLPFSKPPLFSKQETFLQFKEAVHKVLPVVKEATAKERAMMGSRGGVGSINGLKRKRDPDEENNNNEYFFAKFLTSPDLLDLEIADTHFRRQFLFQLLILLNHLLNFTKTAKLSWATLRNRSLQMDFTLEEEQMQWVQEMIGKVIEELRQTTPNGRTFADTATTILDREKNWVKWKNGLCTPFDKEPWSEKVNGEKVGYFEATKGFRDQLREPPAQWKWELGTEALTEIWTFGYTGLDDLKNPFQPGDVKDFVKKIKQEDGKIVLRKQRLEKMAAMARSRAAAAAPPKPVVETPPAIVVSSSEADGNTTAEAGVRSESTSGILPAPRPVAGSAASPLHPSLPPKPGSPSKLAPSSQEPVKTVTSAPNVVSSPAPVVRTATPTPIPASAPVDSEIAKYEENKQLWAWLALRAARDHYLQHFGKIGTGDIEQLAQEIEKEKEKDLKGEDVTGGPNGDEQGTGSPPPLMISGVNSEESHGKDNEGDVKMEG